MKNNFRLYFFSGWLLYFFGCYLFVRTLVNLEVFSIINIFLASIYLLPGLFLIKIYREKTQLPYPDKYFQMMFHTSSLIFIMGFTGFASIGFNRPFQYAFGLLFSLGFYMLIFSFLSKIIWYIYQKVKKRKKTGS